MNSHDLPTLREGEEFVCENGCGACEPEPFDFEYSREEFPDGSVISKTVKGYRSKCCRYDIAVYSEVDETLTPLDEYR